MFRSRKVRDPDPDDKASLPHGSEDLMVIVDRAVNPYLVMFHDPASFRAEQVRSLRNKLVAMNPDGESKSLVVTSAVRGEGKTVTAINLAMAFAELERHAVLLVDADLRHPSVERYLNLNPEPGLSDLLMGRAGLDRVLRPSGFRNLTLMGAGSRVDNPAELFTGARMDEMAARCKERFQYIVLDTPPVLPATDAGVLAARADGTLLVIRLEHSTRSHAKDALRNLQDLGANVLGTFVTEVRGADPDADRRLTYGRSKD